MKRFKLKSEITEADIHSFTRKLLREHANKNVIAMHIANGQRSSPTMGAIMKNMGTLTGAADWLVCVGPKAHFLELKKPNGVITVEQRAFMAKCRDAGIPYEISRSFSDSERVLKSWGALRVA